jgi:hydrogenase-4 membrane subunit HyfE
VTLRDTGVAQDAAAAHAAHGTAAAASGSDARMARARKYRQAAIVYLHVGILYEAAVYVFWRQGILPEARGPAWLWLLLGALLAGAISYALWRYQKTWLALLIWALHTLRLPALIEGAFFARAHTGVDVALVPPAFYLTAIVIVLINLGFLARAGFDL